MNTYQNLTGVEKITTISQKIGYRTAIYDVRLFLLEKGVKVEGISELADNFEKTLSTYGNQKL